LPISAFAEALRTFRSGHLTHDELSWELDRQLAIEKASPQALLEILKVQQLDAPLPVEAHEALARYIADWPRDPTIITGVAREPRPPRAPGAGVGDIIQGRFSLVALIGEGGMSRVFKAIDLRRVEAGAADPYVAVKVLTEPINEYFGSIVALQREAHKLQSLSHPNIVRVIDCDRDDATVFMTMEYLPGESLQKKLRASRNGLEPAAAASVVAAIGEALEYAHRNRIVHGDLKPGNVIVSDKGTIKVIDFGMARFLARPEGTVSEPASQSTPKAVTPRYASPEMLAGRDPEPADDVYALACIAYETLTGKHPFGRQSDPRSRDPQAQPPRPPGMPAHQHAALIKALAYDRKNRTQSIAHFLDEFFARRRDAWKRWWPWAAAGLVLVILAGVATVDWLGARGRAAAPIAEPMHEQAAAGSLIRDCPTCPSLTVLPTGRFKQGASPNQPDASPFELPQHIVVIGHPIAMSTNETTVGEFREFVTATHRDVAGCATYFGLWKFQHDANWDAPGFAQTDAHPVTCVSWDDAVAYASWLSTKTGHSYRLPSASEWEYAARAGGEASAPWEANTVDACLDANVADRSAEQRFPGWTVFPCNDGFVKTAPVGSFRPNAFGIHDLLGNVFEWVADCWSDDYAHAPIDGSARGGQCDEHELRGGSWFSSPRYVSAAYRNRFETGYRSSSVGFRVVRDLTP
jgi:formylglycine-generating enzyme required for sulfatase activity/predicted Ser/Thr protein kinase